MIKREVVIRTEWPLVSWLPFSFSFCCCSKAIGESMPFLSVDRTTIIPSLLQPHGLTLILQRPLGKELAQPRAEPTRMNQQPPAHGSNANTNLFSAMNAYLT